MGYEEDINICLEVYAFASSYINEYMASEKIKFISHEEYIKAENAYGHGFASGLEKVLTLQRESNKESWGLVMKVPNEVTEFLESITSTTEQLPKNNLKELYYELIGYNHGNNVNFRNILTVSD